MVKFCISNVPSLREFSHLTEIFCILNWIFTQNYVAIVNNVTKKICAVLRPLLRHMSAVSYL